MKQYIDFGGAHLPMYNLFIGLGIALAMLLLQYNKKFISYSLKDQSTVHLSLLIATIGGFISAHVVDAISQNTAINTLKSGLTLLGGLVPAIIFVVIILKYYKIPVIDTLNLLTPYFAITHCFGRIGCFFAGCCFGKPLNNSLGVTFPDGSIPFQFYHSQLPLHPTQLYEAVFVILLSGFIFYKNPKNSFFIYIGSYSIFRFVLEYFRADDRGKFFNQTIFSPSQIICLMMFGITMIYLVKVKLRLDPPTSRF